MKTIPIKRKTSRLPAIILNWHNTPILTEVQVTISSIMAMPSTLLTDLLSVELCIIITIGICFRLTCVVTVPPASTRNIVSDIFLPYPAGGSSAKNHSLRISISNRVFSDSVRLMACWVRPCRRIPLFAFTAYSDQLFYEGNNVTSYLTAAQWQYAIRNISWETTKTFGLGLDVPLLDGRLRLTADYYYKITKDMILECRYTGLCRIWQPSTEYRQDENNRFWNWKDWNDHINDFSLRNICQS